MASGRSVIDPEEFAAATAIDRVRLVDEAYGPEALLMTSVQKPSCVLMHMIHRLGSRIAIAFVDTQFHFPETLALRDEYAARYGLAIATWVPDLTPAEQRARFGIDLWACVEGQPHCCRMRKEEPALRAGAGKRATINGLMRAEGGRRASIGPIGFDPRTGAATYHPLLDWTFEDLDAYIREHDLPVHPLYEKGYLSIGCAPCTTPVLPGEDRRAGRWRHLRACKPQYCNINYSDGGGI